ncbi:CBS domain-containing protein [Asanoa sp. NPDC050611]|uniref:CBS domain-containing protein n=1 Tax=Asanoa sp. NPDC050611 TaxID=3157098 RepID=UPI0033D3065E
MGDATEPDVKKLTLRLGDLASANAGVAFVRADQPLAAAVTKMVAKDYSQLAVLADDDTIVGSVSWESIGKAQLSHKHVDLVAATTPPERLDITTICLARSAKSSRTTSSSSAPPTAASSVASSRPQTSRSVSV